MCFDLYIHVPCSVFDTDHTYLGRYMYVQYL